MIRLPTAGLLVIKNKKLLLAFSRNKRCFYLPGGKIDSGETAEEALCREISEELNTIITTAQLVYYTHIAAPAYGELNGTIMEQDCFFVKSEINPEATGEIEELKYFSLSEYLRQMNIAPGVVMILEKLSKDGYID